HQVDEQRLLEEFSAHDRRVNARDLLVDNPPRADVQVADLGIAHQAVGQAHALARGVNERPGVLLQEFGIAGRPRQRDGVRFALRAIAPAVEDDEDYRFGCWHSLRWTRWQNKSKIKRQKSKIKNKHHATRHDLSFPLT